MRWKMPESNAAEMRKTYQNLGVAPLPLIGRNRIATIFGKRSAMVLEWYKAGAPIWFNGKAYMTEFNQLFYWLLQYEFGGQKNKP